MNKSIAIGLIMGSVLGILTALVTKEYSYYAINKKGQSFEISKESYDRRIYPNGKQAENRINFRFESKYDTVLTIASIIGGIGVGYIIGGNLETRKNKL